MYLEIGMNCSSHGWLAYWNILRTYCDGLNISFPKVVQVRVSRRYYPWIDVTFARGRSILERLLCSQVNHVNYENLSADISIINSSDDEELSCIPSDIESVPLKDLYVATSQKIPGNLDVVAECLDQLRFVYVPFYTNRNMYSILRRRRKIDSMNFVSSLQFFLPSFMVAVGR